MTHSLANLWNLTSTVFSRTTSKWRRWYSHIGILGSTTTWRQGEGFESVHSVLFLWPTVGEIGIVDEGCRRATTEVVED
jgi:hypothetical protein